MENYLNFKKINPDTAHMMGGTAERNGVTKIGYNCGVSPVGFERLCRETQGKLRVVTTALCDFVRKSVDFEKVKKMITVSGVGDFVFRCMMSWHKYITKQDTNFLKINTPCISDLVAADAFLRAVFPEEYPSAMREILFHAINQEEEEEYQIPNLAALTVELKPASLSMNLEYKGSYLDDNVGHLFSSKDEHAVVAEFQEVVLHFSDSSVLAEDYASFLVASVFTH